MKQIYQIRSASGVKDGTISECPVLLRGHVYDVSERTYERWVQSAGNDIELVEILIPNPRKKANAKEA